MEYKDFMINVFLSIIKNSNEGKWTIDVEFNKLINKKYDEFKISFSKRKEWSFWLEEDFKKIKNTNLKYLKNKFGNPENIKKDIAGILRF